MGAKHGGAAQVAMGAAAAAERSAQIERTVVFVSPARYRRFELPPSARVEEVAVPWAESGAGRLAWLTWGLARAAGKCGATHVLALGGGGLGPSGSSTTLFVQQSLPFSAEAVATLPFRARPRIEAIRRMMALAAARAATVVVQTETMAGLVSRGLHVDRGRIHVVLPGVPPDILRAGADQVPCGGRPADVRLLYVGNSSPYKNLGTLARALDDLRRSRRNVVLAATVEPAHPLASRPDVEALGMLDRRQLLEQYRRASCLVLPSLTETVGLPLLEAMALSVPVVAADRPYAREICGPAAVYFDPRDPASLAAAVGRVVDDGELRREMLSRGRQRAAEFPADGAFDRLLAVVLSGS